MALPPLADKNFSIHNAPQIWRRAIIVATAVAFLLKAALAWNTLGTNDSLMWDASLEKLSRTGGASLYQGLVAIFYQGSHYDRELFNHPPFMILALKALAALADWSHLQLRTILRLTCAVADVVSLALVCRIAATRSRISPLALTSLAICPVSIFVSGFHGNTDPIMICFVLLSAYFLEIRKDARFCGIFLGMAMNIKIAPVILIPALLFYLKTWRERLVCLGFASLVFLLPAVPYLYSEPLELFRCVLGYRSIPGHWGVTRVSGVWPAYAHYGAYFVLAVVIVLSAWMNYPRRRASLFDQWGVVFFAFIALTPGFGIQYLVWLVPWVVTLGPVATIGHYILSGAFAFGVYTFWCGSIPWYFADSIKMGSWTGWPDALAILAWLSVLVTLETYRTRFTAEQQPYFDVSAAS